MFIDTNHKSRSSSQNRVRNIDEKFQSESPISTVPIDVVRRCREFKFLEKYWKFFPNTVDNQQPFRERLFGKKKMVEYLAVSWSNNLILFLMTRIEVWESHWLMFNIFTRLILMIHFCWQDCSLGLSKRWISNQELKLYPVDIIAIQENLNTHSSKRIKGLSDVWCGKTIES